MELFDCFACNHSSRWSFDGSNSAGIMLAAFGFIGSEYDEAKIYDQAVKKASEGIQAIADKVRRTRDAYHEANTAVWSQLKHVEIERTQSMLAEQEHDKAA